MSFEATIAIVSCILVGFSALLYGVYQRNKLQSCKNWPQVIATISKAEVLRDTGADSSGYLVSVLYDYSVHGESYQGSRVGFRQRAYIRKKNAQAVVDRYPPNTTVPVFYDPEKPSEGVLVREYPDNILLMVCGSGLLILVFIILIAHS